MSTQTHEALPRLVTQKWAGGHRGDDHEAGWSASSLKSATPSSQPLSKHFLCRSFILPAFPAHLQHPCGPAVGGHRGRGSSAQLQGIQPWGRQAENREKEEGSVGPSGSHSVLEEGPSASSLIPPASDPHLLGSTSPVCCGHGWALLRTKAPLWSPPLGRGSSQEPPVPTSSPHLWPSSTLQ